MRATFYVLIGGFLLGVVSRSLFEIDVYTVGAVLLLLLSLLVLWRVWQMQNQVLYVVLFFLVCLIGVVRTEYAHHEYERGRVLAEGTHIQSEGTIIAEVDERDTYVVLKVGLRDSDTVFRVKAPMYPSYEYGDDVVIQGRVHVPESFETENGRVFNYPGYLMKEGVHYELRDAVITERETNSGNPVTQTLLNAKHTWLESIASLLPEPAASLAGGVIVGAKQSLGEHWLELFRITGIIHIVVLSGYNLTLVANGIIGMTARLSQSVRFLLGSLGIISFAIMVGGGATVVRASIMAFLGMLAGFINRRYVLLRALLFAGFVMVAWNPFVLLFDTGFQLSFIATAGLIALAPYFELLFFRVPKLFGLREIVAATIATQLAVLPLLLFHIGLISLVAPLVNILILPLVPLVMGLGFLTGLIGIVSGVIAVPFAFVTHALLSYMFFVVDIFSRIPFASVELPALPWWLVVFAYGTVTCLLLWQNKKPLT